METCLCLFCDHYSSSWQSLKAHLEKHLSFAYYCSGCDGGVNDSSIRCSLHQSANMNAFDFLIPDNEQKTIQFWIRNWINYLQSGIHRDRLVYFPSCFLCKRLQSYLHFDNKQANNGNGDLVTHLRHHMRYFQCYCKICRNVFSKNNIAKHLLLAHNINRNSDEHIIYLTPIRKLEDLLTRCYTEKFPTATYESVVAKRMSQESSEHLNSNLHISNPNNVVISSCNSMISDATNIRNTNHPTNSELNSTHNSNNNVIIRLNASNSIANNLTVNSTPNSNIGYYLNPNFTNIAYNGGHNHNINGNTQPINSAFIIYSANNASNINLNHNNNNMITSNIINTNIVNASNNNSNNMMTSNIMSTNNIVSASNIVNTSNNNSNNTMTSNIMSTNNILNASNNVNTNNFVNASEASSNIINASIVNSNATDIVNASNFVNPSNIVNSGNIVNTSNNFTINSVSTGDTNSNTLTMTVANTATCFSIESLISETSNVDKTDNNVNISIVSNDESAHQTQESTFMNLSDEKEVNSNINLENIIDQLDKTCDPLTSEVTNESSSVKIVCNVDDKQNQIEMHTSDIIVNETTIGDTHRPIFKVADAKKLCKPCSVVIKRLTANEIALWTMRKSDNQENVSITPIETKSNEKTMEERLKECPLEIYIITDADRQRVSNYNKRENVDNNNDFYCIFCNKHSIGTFEFTVRHYQEHLNYYPIQCGYCEKLFLDMYDLFNHHFTNHSETDLLRYKKCLLKHIYMWINKFLNKDKKRNVASFGIRKYCPLCVCLYDSKILDSSPTYLDKSYLSLMAHICKHLSYDPLYCRECLKQGKEVTFFAKNMKVFTHILKFHNEKKEENINDMLEDLSIPLLSEFLSHFLLIHGIKQRSGVITNRIPVNVIKRFEETEESKIQKSAVSISSLIDINTVPDLETIVNNPQSSSFPLIINNGTNTITITTKSSNSNQSNSLLKKLISNPSTTTSSLSNQISNPLPSSSFSSPSYVVNLSPSDADDDFSLSNTYICIFCEKDIEFTSKLESCSHFAEHLAYYPVVCLLCSMKFADLESLMHHHSLLHPTPINNLIGTNATAVISGMSNDYSNLLYFVNEDVNIEKWVDEFLDFQSSKEFWSLLSNRYRDLCPVCKKFTKTSFQSDDNNSIENSDTLDHIYQHLNYFPYECIMCKRCNVIKLVPTLGSIALKHLKYKHKITNENINLSEFYVKKITIPNLESFVSEFLVNNRFKESDKQLPQEQEQPTTETINIVSQSDQSATQKTLNNAITLDFEPIKSQPKLLSSQEKLHCNESSIKSSNKSLLKSSSSDLNKRLSCYHCQARLESWTSLKEHHYKVHPSLSLIGYPLNN